MMSQQAALIATMLQFVLRRHLLSTRSTGARLALRILYMT